MVVDHGNVQLSGVGGLEAALADLVKKRVKRHDGETRHMPPEFIKGHNDVAPAFLNYLGSLVGRVPAVEVI